MTLHHIRVSIALLFVLTAANLVASFVALSTVRELKQELLLDRQRVVGALAGDSCDTGGVNISSQASRSFISAPEQVGEHGVTVMLWRATAGSGGIAGGATAGK